MNTNADPVEPEKEYVISTLKCILADQYVLMNRTSRYIYDSFSPFSKNNNKIFHKIYDELKKNTEAIAELLKAKSQNIFLSINDIISNTRVKKASVSESRVATLEMMINDHKEEIRHLDNAINELAFATETNDIIVLKSVKETHRKICFILHKYVKQIFNYSSKVAVS